MGDCQDLRTYLIAQHGGVQIGDTPSGQNGYLKCAASAVQAFADSPAWMLITSAAAGERPIHRAASPWPCPRPAHRCTGCSRRWASRTSTTAQAYAGDVGMARVTQAFSSLIGTAVTAVPVLITGIITMAWIALTFALYITGPFKLAFATYTGKAKMAKEWAGDLVHAWASRLAYGILLSLTILIIAWMLASTLSFGLRLLWLGVILFFFWKLVQKVQEMIRPGAASIAPNLAGDVQRRTAGGARTVTRTATRSTVGAGAGVIAAGQRRRMMAADPTRGPLRRTAGTLLTPVSLLTGGLRGAAFGPQDAQRRAWKTMSRGADQRRQGSERRQAAKRPKKDRSTAGTTGTTVTGTSAGTRSRHPRSEHPAARSAHGTARDAAASAGATAAPATEPRRSRPDHPARQHHCHGLASTASPPTARSRSPNSTAPDAARIDPVPTAPIAPTLRRSHDPASCPRTPRIATMTAPIRRPLESATRRHGHGKDRHR